MTFFRSRRGVTLLCALLLLALFLVRPGANRLRARVVLSISLALQRPVEVSHINLRLLPQPGFDLEDFVVRDDPSFGAEPMIRAHDVTAVVRMSSLLRGRIEIARLSLNEPSLNLVKNAEGHWNLEGLVERAAKVPVAPTAKAKSESRPAFPYIEAGSARINFKFGPEKKPYALTDADFALWQDSENTWGLRLEARPVRTDFNLSDTGTVHVTGSWQRAESLRATPLQFTVQWEGAQLGQASKLAYGDDKGWRGEVELTSTLRGTPGNLRVTADASVRDFRRYDILGSSSTLAAQCRGVYSSVNHALADVSCRAPAGEGLVTLQGDLGVIGDPSTYKISVRAKEIPVQSLVTLARRVKRDLPNDLAATGKVDAAFTFSQEGRSEPGPVWKGGGEGLDLHMQSKQTKTDLIFDRLHFAVARQRGEGDGHPSETIVDVGPFNLSLGRPAPVAVKGRLSRSGYTFAIQGDAQLRRLLQAAQTIGVSAPKISGEGVARLDLRAAGPWVGAPEITGKIQLHEVRAEIPGVSAPINIAAANLVVSPDQVRATSLSALFAGSSWHGSISVPRECARCAVRFNLAADDIDTNKLVPLWAADSTPRPWYRFLSSAPKSGLTFLASLHAEGRVTANHLLVRKLGGSRVSADVRLDDGTLELLDLRADVLGGIHQGDWKINFKADPPEYSGNGIVDRVSLVRLAEAMHDGWITGTASGAYELKAAGWTAADLLASADGTMHFEGNDGMLPHISLVRASTPLRMDRFAGRLLLRGGRLEVAEGKLESPDGIFQISGTATLASALNIKLTRGDTRHFDITGPLSAPHIEVAPTPETQAALKP